MAIIPVCAYKVMKSIHYSISRSLFDQLEGINIFHKLIVVTVQSTMKAILPIYKQMLCTTQTTTKTQFIESLPWCVYPLHDRLNFVCIKPKYRGHRQK